eukprot:CAMPEP_0116848000 /NCGR_PEP_ID=MMETSP0418-20121206/14745_1 /TAXON_ID=1158023 /ORGANISM="Astrosyne radiata, Strain 13vi08-1A" /LENGTH=313 /DNA_ID=CAMNT_0004479505 /DNA_START=128 /DNA_END=1069 /DNA_ORIENTATION=+
MITAPLVGPETPNRSGWFPQIKEKTRSGFPTIPEDPSIFEDAEEDDDIQLPGFAPRPTSRALSAVVTSAASVTSPVWPQNRACSVDSALLKQQQQQQRRPQKLSSLELLGELCLLEKSSGGVTSSGQFLLSRPKAPTTAAAAAAATITPQKSKSSTEAFLRDQLGLAKNARASSSFPLHVPSSSSRPIDTHLPSEQERTIVPEHEIREWDVLCGRGGKSNHHPGNKRYRQVVGEMKSKYRAASAKTNKTALSRAIVDYVEGYGGRFLKKDPKTGTYFVLTKSEARKKTSQALRETKEIKWTFQEQQTQQQRLH